MVGSPAAYQRMAEDRIAHGFDEGLISRLKDRVALGGDAFVERMRGMCDANPEYEAQCMLRHRTSWDAVVGAVERMTGRAWSEFAFVRGDWGRAAIYYLARQYAGLTLAEIGEAAGGVKYPAVSQMIKRFEKRMQSDAVLRKSMQDIERMLNIQT